MPLVSTDAVVLHAFDYLETSRILRLATRDAGVVSVIARGARRARGGFGAALDLFAGGVAQVHVRPGRELQQLTGFDVQQSRAGLALELERFTAASMIAELTLRFAPHEDHGELYDVLVAALDVLAAAPRARARDAALAGAWQLVSSLGFAPALDSCTTCHDTVAADVVAHFSPAGGGICCPRCAPRATPGRRLPPSARDAIRGWLAGEAPDIADAPSRRAHVRLLREFLHQHLADDRALPALDAWVEDAGIPLRT